LSIQKDDIEINIKGKTHVIELKIAEPGFSLDKPLKQINDYMSKIQSCAGGYLIVFDARRDPKETFQEMISVDAGNVKIYQVNINPTAPSKL